MVELIGRYKERKMLDRCLKSSRSEFVIVSGRRRIGKTFLVSRLYADKFAFYYTGGHNLSNNEQLARFSDCLRRFSGSCLDLRIKDWFQAFEQLQNYLGSLSGTEKKIVFFDEMPWIDSHNSRFVKALEYFWNSWASLRDDILFISSGSATSWMNDKLLDNQGGLHNRVTCKIFLEPFTLGETEEYLQKNGFCWDRYMILQTYMILGGVPFYLSLLNNQCSLPQNIDELCFSKNGLLSREFDELYNALFSNADKYISIVKTLSDNEMGLVRTDIVKKTKIQGSTLSRMLDNLEKCGFIINYTQYGKNTKDAVYRLSDFYSLFYFRFIKPNYKEPNFWQKHINQPAINTWQGLTFELICLMHLEQIKKALGLSVISTKSTTCLTKDLQIDLVIERADRYVNLCEMKFSADKFSISRDYADKIRERTALFRDKLKRKMILLNTFVTTYGVLKNSNYSVCNSEITMDQLFE